MTYLKIKGQEASSWLKMVTRKMKLEVLPDTVHKLSPPQARKNCFIWMGHLYGAFGPGTTCWPGGGLKCSPGVGGSKMASRGVDWLLAPPTPTYALGPPTRTPSPNWTPKRGRKLSSPPTSGSWGTRGWTTARNGSSSTGPIGTTLGQSTVACAWGKQRRSSSATRRCH